MGFAKFSPDQKTIVTMALKDSSIKIWDAFTGKLLQTLITGPLIMGDFGSGEQGTSSVSFNSDGGKILTTNFAGYIKLWQASTGNYC